MKQDLSIFSKNSKRSIVWSKVSLPDMVGGATGEKSVVEDFRKVFESLYNSCDSRDAMNELKKF